MPDDLPPAPEPTIEEPEHFPGGPDAIDQYWETPPELVTPDLPVQHSAAVDVDMPDELAAPEEGDEPSSDGASEPQADSPA